MITIVFLEQECYNSKTRVVKMGEEKLRIRISGKRNNNDININNITAKDLNMLNAIIGGIVRNSRTEDSSDSSAEDTSFSIRNGSIVVDSNRPLMPATTMVSELSRNHDFADIKNQPMRRLATELIDKYGKLDDTSISIESVKDNVIISKVTIDSSVTYKDSELKLFVPVEDYIYGTIVDMGGVNPNIHIDTGSETVTVSIGKDELQEVKENLLYKPKGIYASFEENIQTGARRKYKFIRFVEYNPRPSKEELDNFIKKQIEGWSKIDNLEEKLKELS